MSDTTEKQPKPMECRVEVTLTEQDGSYSTKKIVGVDREETIGDLDLATDRVQIAAKVVALVGEVTGRVERLVNAQSDTRRIERGLDGNEKPEAIGKPVAAVPDPDPPTEGEEHH